ncbi:glycosyltransferase family 2 protein [Mucilaginibacter pedocola]|uniref:glycosyltransferase family 2 protein n=1 Tax=Mucilaginibacter pedocola TaxID=1792845 RepID=UPI00138FD381|nr:glycosyltransferase family 2 protein [Mucilaginibacter pedocola]
MTIVTTVLNAVSTIEQTIVSVINQTYKNIEYIVIDGGSTDGTLQVIEKYRDNISVIVSEPDKGIADGFNKGIALATGDWIGLVNADDWYTPNAVELMMANTNAGDNVCCGNLLLIGQNGFQRIKKSKVSWLNYGMYIMHPTCFVRNSVYKRVGGYDTTLKIAMDFDLFLRIKRAGYSIKYVDEHITCMRTFGVSNDVQKMHREELAVMKRNLNGFNFVLSGMFNYLNKLRWRLWYNDPFREVKITAAS